MPDETPAARRLEPLLRRWAAAWGLPGLEHGLAVSFDDRLHRTLGRCAPERGRITLHAALRDAPPRQLAEVLCHEAAHVAAVILHGRSVPPHGAEWEALVSQAGFTPRTRAPGLTPSRSRSTSAARSVYEHRCLVCQTVRFARRPVPRWRCAECVAAGLDGEMTITRHARASGPA